MTNQLNKWEYNIQLFTVDKYSQDALNEYYGSEGWEIVSVLPISSSGSFLYVFRRPLFEDVKGDNSDLLAENCPSCGKGCPACFEAGKTHTTETVSEQAYKELLNRFNLAMDKLDQIAFWVNPSNGMDVYGAIGRIQDLLLPPEPVSETDPKLSDCDHLIGRDEVGWIYDSHNYLEPSMLEQWTGFVFCPKCGEKL